MGFLVCLLFELRFSGGLPSRDCIKLSDGVPASIAALRVGRRVEDAVERAFTVVVLSEWMQEDVDHSELIISRVDDVVHSALLSARVCLVFGLRFHNLAKHVLKHVS